MASKKIYTGIVLEDDYLKVARISVSGKKAQLVYLDKIKLVENLEKTTSSVEEEVPVIFDAFEDELEDDSIFGIESDSEDLNTDLGSDPDEFDIDLDLDNLDSGEELIDVDMAEDSSEAAPASNELLLYNLLSNFSHKKIHLGLNIQAGDSIFQILKDVDFSSTKKKDLKIIVDDRLEALYGTPKAEDFYSYTVRDDGALLLASIDDEPQTLQLLDRTSSLYRGKLFIDEILPDEVLLIGLIRANYELDPNSITAVIQYGETYCRVLFMKGKELWIVSPIITEGTNSRKFLNTVFSKILFQLDTGEVPNLDRILLCNNILGDEAVDFFQERFPDIDVSGFTFEEEYFDTEKYDSGAVASFTTAIGMAWASAGFNKDKFPKLSFLPNSVKDRQKIFKLQWHGYLMLFLIFITPFIFNYYYLKNSAEIDSLQDRVATLDQNISLLQSTVNNYNQTNQDLSGIQSRLMLLDELSNGTLTWSVNLDIINRGINNIDSIWLTSLVSTNNKNTIEIQGYSLYKNRIPMIADIFDNAVLLDVSREEIREKEVFSFRYLVNRIVANENMYTPESAKGLDNVLGN